MKSLYLIFILPVFFIACTSTKLAQKKSTLTFQNFQNLQIGKSTQLEIQALFGQPDKKDKNDDLEKWSYDSENGYQRLTLTFSISKLLQSSLWMLQPEEAETRVETIQSFFVNGNFEEKKMTLNNSHGTPNSSKNLIDYKLGVSLLLDESRNVQAIAFFDPKLARKLASLKDSEKTPSAIGK